MTSNHSKVVDNIEKKQYCSFWIDNYLYGFNIIEIDEVIDDLNLFALHHCHSAIIGYMNIRGQILLVVDLRNLLGFDLKQQGQSNRVVIFKPNIANSFGILVDRIGDVVNVNQKDIENYNDSNNSMDISNESDTMNEASLMKETCKLEGKLLTVLHVKNLVKFVEQKQHNYLQNK